MASPKKSSQKKKEIIGVILLMEQLIFLNFASIRIQVRSLLQGRQTSNLFICSTKQCYNEASNILEKIVWKNLKIYAFLKTLNFEVPLLGNLFKLLSLRQFSTTTFLQLPLKIFVSFSWMTTSHKKHLEVCLPDSSLLSGLYGMWSSMKMPISHQPTICPLF